MKKNGFTLIEILAVIVVLGLLTIIITPTVSNLLKDSEESLYNKQIDSILSATKKYVVEHSELLPDELDYNAIYISDLISNGVIDNDEVINPKTKEQMNGCVVIGYNSEFSQYDYSYREDCSITITFDPEGGSVSTTSKDVMIGKAYGELPTPTRDGYTFKGWRGKNIFNMTAWLNSFTTATHGTIIKGDNSLTIIATSNDAYTDSWLGDSVLKIYAESEAEYTVSWKSNNNNVAFVYGFIDGQSSDGYRVAGNNASEKYFVITTPQDIGYITYRVGISNIGESITYSNLQLEKGDSATVYEPYQEFASNSIVKKGSDYTMHAIWEVAE